MLEEEKHCEELSDEAAWERSRGDSSRSRRRRKSHMNSEAALFCPSAYRLKSSRCSSAAKFRHGETRTLLTLVSQQKSYLWWGTTCPPCELSICCQYNHHSNATKRPSRGRRGFWSPFGETLIKRRSVNHLKLGTLSSYLFSDIWRWFTFVLLFRSLPFCTSAPGLNKSITLTHDILLFCNLCTRSNLQVLQKQ